MIRGWFQKSNVCYNDFIKALLVDDVDYMNEYMNQISLQFPVFLTFPYLQSFKVSAVSGILIGKEIFQHTHIQSFSKTAWSIKISVFSDRTKILISNGNNWFHTVESFLSCLLL